MIITSEISRLIQTYTKDPAATAVEASWQAPPRIPLEPGQKVQAEILTQLPDNRYLTRVAKELMVMDLPMPLQSGQTLELTFISRDPAPLFALSRSANSGAPVNISDTGRQLGALTREAAAFDGEISLPRINRLMDGPPTDAGVLADRLRSAVSRSGIFYESHQAQWLNGQRSLAELLEEPQGTISPSFRNGGEAASGTRPETGSRAVFGDRQATGRQASTQASSAPAPATTSSSTPSSPQSPSTIAGQLAAKNGDTVGQKATGTATDTAGNHLGETRSAGIRPETGDRAAIGERPAAGRQPPARAELPSGEPVRTGPTNQSAPQTATPPTTGEKSPTAPPGVPTPETPPGQAATVEASAARPGAPPPTSNKYTPDTSAPAPNESTRLPAGEVSLPPGEAVAKFRQASEPATLAGKADPSTPTTRNELATDPKKTADLPAEQSTRQPSDSSAPVSNQPRQPGVWVTRSPLDAPVPPHPGHTADPLTATPDAARQTAGLEATLRPAPEHGTPARLVDPQTLPIIREQLETLQNREFTWNGLAWPQQKMEWTIEEREAEDGEEARRAWHTRLRLELPNLGEVSVRLRLAANGVTVRIRGDREDSVTALRSGGEDLRQALVRAGLDLTALTVDHEKS